MRVLIFLFLAMISVSALADVFKCIGKYGQATYQNSPCSASKKEQQLDIKFDPVKEAEAKAKLEAIRSEYETKKAERLKEEEEQRSQHQEAASLEFARRSAIAQQEQAQAQQRQANALENQNLMRPLYYLLPGRPVPSPTIPLPRENPDSTIPLPRENPRRAPVTSP
ncbi:DUF4124 domain-containing protein [Methylomonas sp. MgM2]